MFLLALLLGAGVALYVWFVVTVPSGQPGDADARPTRLTRLVPRLRTGTADRPRADLLVGAALLVVAISLLAVQTGANQGAVWLIPLLVLLAGAALAWSELDAAEKRRLAGEPARRTSVVLRVGGGLALAITGVVIFVAGGRPLADAVTGVLAGLAILAGTAFVLAPLGLRLWRDLVAERAAHARAAERADIAAHLHDSVLQTLSLIRARADDPQFVRTMARGRNAICASGSTTTAPKRATRSWRRYGRRQPRWKIPAGSPSTWSPPATTGPENTSRRWWPQHGKP